MMSQARGCREGGPVGTPQLEASHRRCFLRLRVREFVALRALGKIVVGAGMDPKRAPLGLVMAAWACCRYMAFAFRKAAGCL